MTATSELKSASEAEAPAKGGVPLQFISFRVGQEEYAIDIMSVREIKGWTETTELPNQPEFVRGVVNLRGTIVPIFDLGCRFGLGLTKATPTHVVIIVAVNERTIGLLVDAVSDILDVQSDEIKPVPDVDRTIGSEFLAGIIAAQDGMVVLLSLQNLLSRQVIGETSAVAA
ncbi:Chemotaxis protein CheW [Hartmannibacter diazotrophicus]|uniref:Chemotaxis protein CheW n=1 Tax=Hartmannibacter diazotrophicus TaxID=1482074 RepID=A0A2C9DD78_9HYPH|nr:chemotaxis protein CheW [Hartmannibacter diazotrophicus]SON58257.1 Chemotaxis protein CheW [Hartmannibacter diazotrophicus]